MIRHKHILLFFSLLLFQANNAIGDDNDVIINNIAIELKEAVMRNDINMLMGYVSSSGTYFIDDVHTYNKIKKDINSHDSWLYKHLFSNGNSIKNYFIKAIDQKIIIFRQNDTSIMISYQSSNFDPTDWAECCLIKINGKWYFDGIFYCM